jgi:hypothetical protein
VEIICRLLETSKEEYLLKFALMIIVGFLSVKTHIYIIPHLSQDRNVGVQARRSQILPAYAVRPAYQRPTG